MDGRIDLTISHFVRKEKKKKKKKVGIDVLPVPLESAFSHSMLHNTYLSHFPSTLCVNDDAQRPASVLAHVLDTFLFFPFSFSVSISLPELTRNNLGLWRLKRDLYVVEGRCVQSTFEDFTLRETFRK